jgi:hypothetical protein
MYEPPFYTDYPGCGYYSVDVLVTFREYTVRVEGFFRHWCEREDIGVNFEKLFDLMMREKLLSGCDKDLKLWVQEHRHRNVNTLVELAGNMYEPPFYTDYPGCGYYSVDVLENYFPIAI